ncbi:hypothetical protein EJB05_29341 [Eragrostis curvula]|uniref:Uncharacterized protein n=1 Tax=Eragrostis curvula TaxID=38414 RepID=A0A5J9UUQ5_9POAL|nr:hypothetical protein EJB05_29341 [Eragrostis curvula]
MELEALAAGSGVENHVMKTGTCQRFFMRWIARARLEGLSSPRSLRHISAREATLLISSLFPSKSIFEDFTSRWKIDIEAAEWRYDRAPAVSMAILIYVSVDTNAEI